MWNVIETRYWIFDWMLNVGYSIRLDDGLDVCDFLCRSLMTLYSILDVCELANEACDDIHTNSFKKGPIHNLAIGNDDILDYALMHKTIHRALRRFSPLCRARIWILSPMLMASICTII